MNAHFEDIVEPFVVSISAGAFIALLLFGAVFFIDQYFMEKDKEQHKDWFSICLRGIYYQKTFSTSS